MNTPHSRRRTVTLAVLRHREGWKVFGPSGGWRAFDYKVDAEEAALHLADQVSGAEAEVHVLVQEPWGELRPLVPRHIEASVLCSCSRWKHPLLRLT